MSLASDPPVSERQRRAMWAARSGHSTLGIPKSVGEKFVGPGKDAEFHESDHPRRQDGKFGSGGGSSASKTETAAPASEPTGSREKIKTKDLDGILSKIETAQERVNERSMHLDDDDEEGQKKAERQYGGYEALSYILKNDKKARANPQLEKDEGAHFEYSIGEGGALNGGVQFSIKGDVGEIKWLGSIKSGTGTELMKQTLARMKTAGVKKVTLEAKWDSEAFHERFGFKIVPGEKGGGGLFSTPMELKLGQDMEASSGPPAGAFLQPASRRHLIKDYNFGEWQYAKDLLMKASRRARLHGQDNLADRADAIRHREFGKDDEPAEGAGVVMMNAEGEILLIKRRGGPHPHPNEWDLPGGWADPNDANNEGTARREAFEETGHEIKGEIALIDRDVTGGTDYATYFVPVEKFKPKLSPEHTDSMWCKLSDLPEALHPGTAKTLNGMEEMEVEIAEDHVLRFALALDKESMRTYDKDGRMHVNGANISKANICPYVGNEIPDWDKLGLDGKKIYQMLRHPEELAKATPTFNGLPILIKHEPTDADDHKSDLTIGATGTNANYNHPYLTNDLVFWPKDAIDAIEDEKQKELSCAYHYRADMTPGVYAGAPYDGIMRDIVGNHVALVREGRVGSDIVVGDSKENLMSKTMPLSHVATLLLGAIRAYLPQKLAKDIKLDPSFLADITEKNFKDRKKAIASAVFKQAKPALAKDAKLEDFHDLLDSMEGGSEDSPEPDAATPIPIKSGGTKEQDPELLVISSGDDDPEGEDEEEDDDKEDGEDAEGGEEKLKELGAATGKDKKKAKDNWGKKGKDKKAKDEPPPFVGKPKTGGGMDAANKKVRQGALDAALAKVRTDTRAETIKEMHAIQAAVEHVRPYVGTLALSFDSVDAVYKHTLAALGVKNVDQIPAAGFKALLDAWPKQSSQRRAPEIAQDASVTDSYAKRFPETAHIKLQ